MFHVRLRRSELGLLDMPLHVPIARDVLGLLLLPDALVQTHNQAGIAQAVSLQYLQGHHS